MLRKIDNKLRNINAWITSCVFMASMHFINNGVKDPGILAQQMDTVSQYLFMGLTIYHSLALLKETTSDLYKLYKEKANQEKNTATKYNIELKAIKTFNRAVEEANLSQLQSLFNKLDDHSKRSLLELFSNKVNHIKDSIDVCKAGGSPEVPDDEASLFILFGIKKSEADEINLFLKTQKNYFEKLDEAYTQGALTGFLEKVLNVLPSHAANLASHCGLFSRKDAANVAKTCNIASTRAREEQESVRQKLI